MRHDGFSFSAYTTVLACTRSNKYSSNFCSAQGVLKHCSVWRSIRFIRVSNIFGLFGLSVYSVYSSCSQKRGVSRNPNSSIQQQYSSRCATFLSCIVSTFFVASIVQHGASFPSWMVILVEQWFVLTRRRKGTPC